MNAGRYLRVRDAVVDGRITPEQGALLLEVGDRLDRAHRRRIFWAGFIDGLTLGPFWRWVFRRWGRK